MADLDLAVIGNCAVAGLVAPAGRIVWFCYPRLDADPVFNALIGGVAPAQGFLDVTLRDQAASRQRYLDNTAVVETVLTDAHGGSIRMLDFCPRFERYERTYRPPILVRRIEPLTGRPRLHVAVRPSFDYGAVRPVVSIGSNHLRFGGPDFAMRLTTDLSLSYVVHEVDFTIDRPASLFLGPDEPLLGAIEATSSTQLTATIAWWRDWVRSLNVPFDWQDAVIRAAITLKLCSYEDTGGIVAALTTSIPEAPGSGRTWDYRFCWLRDAYFTVAALNRLSATRTMEDFVRYLIDTVQREGGEEIAPLFAIAPGIGTEERIAPHLAGFNGDGPVRVGNEAVIQRQDDVYGSIILTAAQMFWDERLPLRGDVTLYRRLRTAGEVALRRALEPDAGPWELRERSEPHTFSAAMCWAAVHRIGLIARRVGEHDDADRWAIEAEALRTTILDRAEAAGGGWISGSLDRELADASVLLLPELGLLRPTDPRFLRTLDVIGARLLHNKLLMRYVEQDDFGTPETAFVICTFWYIDALASVGRRAEALDLFENVLAHRNHVGLLSEGISPADGALRGNFPQTYSQVGLIHSAMRLSRSWEEGLWRAS